MKRITVTVDEDVLEDVRRATGERTFSDTINKVLSEAARVNRLRGGLEKLRALGDEAFWPGYYEYIGYEAPEEKKRISAEERRAPRKAGLGRGPR